MAVIMAIPSFTMFGRKEQNPQPIEERKISDITSKLIAWRRGVWVGEDIEIVRTNKVQILFKRDAGSPEGIWSELSLLTYSESEVEEDVRGIVYTNSKGREFKAHARDLWSQQKEEPYAFDLSLSKRSIRSVFKIMSYGDNEVVLQAEGGEREVVSATGQIECFDGSGSSVYTLTRVEEFNIKEKGTAPRKLSESTIAQCLRSWQLGTDLIKDDNVTCKGIVINTNHHMYIFLVNDKDSCYCRAARYETCEKGMVFAQNIRLMVNLQQFVSFMSEDNEKVASEKLEIDESLFNPDACVFTPGGWDARIYWPVKSASDDLMELHGCGGETYRTERPTQKTATLKVEWLH